MTTLVSDPFRWMVDQIENHCGYSSAVLSGIVPDQSHLRQGGYHCSIEDLLRYGNGGDYSNTRPDDKGKNPKYGAAFDMSMSKSDMIKAHKRFMAVWNDRSDPRRQYLNCINGWDGSGDAVRVDYYANVVGYASPDHKWHVHGEMRRRWLIMWIAARAIVSVFKGETKAQWMAYLASQNPAPPTNPAPPVPTPKPPAEEDWSDELMAKLPVLKKGSDADERVIRSWQALLIQRGVVAAKDQNGYCDGDFGKQTDADTKELQKKFGLTPDGVVGKDTWPVGLTGKKS